MLGLSEQVKAMTDAELLVQNERLPVHMYVLAMKSSVFAFLYEAALSSQTACTLTVTPLKGDNLQDVLAALQFLYQASTAISSTESKPFVQSAEEAASLVRFGHKYAVQALLEEGERYLIAKAKVGDGSTLFEDKTGVVAWVSLAESCKLDEFLAHAELFIIKHAGNSFWQSSGGDGISGISQQCFLRLLGGKQEFEDLTEVSWINHNEVWSW